MIKIPLKFQKDRSKTIGGVALTNSEPRITHHRAEYHVPSLFFRKAGDINMMYLMENHNTMLSIKASWQYWEAKHGKGPCDGVWGTSKGIADLAVKHQTAVIQSAEITSSGGILFKTAKQSMSLFQKKNATVCIYCYLRCKLNQSKVTQTFIVLYTRDRAKLLSEILLAFVAVALKMGSSRRLVTIGQFKIFKCKISRMQSNL